MQKIEPNPPAGLRPFKPHQQRAYNENHSRNRCAFFLDMRLGKCLTAIRWMESRSSPGNILCLIVAPIEAIPGWMNECTLEQVEHLVYQGPTKKGLAELVEFCDLQTEANKYIICNRQKLFKSKGRSGRGKPIPTEVSVLPYTGVIWDESTTLKNPRSQTTQAAIDQHAHIPYKTILTGEPTPENSLDIFCQMLWLHGRFMGHTNFWKWRDEYFQQAGYDWCPKKGTMALIREAVHASSVRITQAQAGIKVQMTRHTVPVKLPPVARSLYDSLEKNYGTENVYTKHAVVLHGWLSRFTGGRANFDHPEVLHHDFKLKALDILLQRIGSQAVVLFRYNDEIEATRKYLNQNSDRICAQITGETKLVDRKVAYDDFKNKKFDTLLMQVKVARFGIDLSSADHLIRYSLPYSYEEISQPQQRIVSMNRLVPKHIWDLVCTDTIDEVALETYLNKRTGSRDFMTDFSGRLLEHLKRKWRTK